MKGGSKGNQFSDRELAGQVRNLALGHLYKILQPGYKDKDFQKQMLLKIASSLLPRQNEHTGADGKDLNIEISQVVADKYGFNSSTKSDS